MSLRPSLVAAATAACVLMPRSLPAQALSLGVRAGPSRSHLAGGAAGNRRDGFTLGIAARRHLIGQVAVQVEALYSQKGWSAGQSGLLLDYLEVPVLLRLSAPHWGPGVIVSALAGVSLATEVGCTWHRAVGSPDCGGARDSRTDVGFVASLELEHRFSRGQGSFELRYVQGATNLSPTPTAIPIRNRSIVLLFGFTLDVPPRRRAAA